MGKKGQVSKNLAQKICLIGIWVNYIADSWINQYQLDPRLAI